ncbi:unnamed protein product, partial [Plutella xylostella]
MGSAGKSGITWCLARPDSSRNVPAKPAGRGGGGALQLVPAGALGRAGRVHRHHARTLVDFA